MENNPKTIFVKVVRLWMHEFIRKIFRKTNISYHLIRTGICVYQRARNVIFLENFSNVLHE